jgi:hypothetical protein
MYFGRAFFPEPWIAYTDQRRSGHACPDGVLVLRDRVVLIEAKLSYNTRGWTQLDSLYRPLAEIIWGLPVVRVLVVKHPRAQRPQVEDVGELETLGYGGAFLWHWMP